MVQLFSQLILILLLAKGSFLFSMKLTGRILISTGFLPITMALQLVSILRISTFSTKIQAWTMNMSSKLNLGSNYSKIRSFKAKSASKSIFYKTKTIVQRTEIIEIPSTYIRRTFY